MPGFYRDWVRQVFTGSGTSNLTPGAAVTGYRSLASAGFVDGEIFPYSMTSVDSAGNPSGEFEVGFGALATSGTVFQRLRVLESSNTNAPVNFTAGNKHLIVGLPADIQHRLWGLTQCRLSLDTNWSPISDISSSSTLRLLPGPGGGQVSVPGVPGYTIFNVGNVGTSGVSLTLPTADTFAARTCGITNGSVSGTHSLATAFPLGTLITGTGIPTGTYILASTTTTFTMSRPATATNASASLTCYYSTYDVFALIDDYTTHNRDSTTGMQKVELVTYRWSDNSTPAAKVFTNGAPPISVNVNGVYMGTIVYITSTTSADNAKQRFLYNQFNQLPRRLFVQDAVSNYNYTTASWRISNADYANQVEFVVGGADGRHHGHGLDLTMRGLAGSSSGSTTVIGITTDADASPGVNIISIGGGGVVYSVMPGSCKKTNHPGIGYHRCYMSERGEANGIFWGGTLGGNTLEGFVLG